MHAGMNLIRDVNRRISFLAVIPILVAACATAASPVPSAPATSAGPSTPAASPSAVAKTLELAYISFAVANSYDAPMLAAAKASAAAGNANLTVFDGNLDPATQTKQLQDAIASGKYDGIVLQPV